MKLDAIHSLKEMISANQALIQLDLNNFLESICPLFSDREYQVREATMHLFRAFLLLPNRSKGNTVATKKQLIKSLFQEPPLSMDFLRNSHTTSFSHILLS